MTILSPLSNCNRVIVFSPSYEAFTSIPYLITGKKAILVETDNGTFYPNLLHFKQTLEQYGKETALVIINSPNNPTGAVYPSSLLEEMATILSDYPHIGVISDEVYRVMVYDGKKHDSIARYLPKQTLIVGGEINPFFSQT